MFLRSTCRHLFYYGGLQLTMVSSKPIKLQYSPLIAKGIIINVMNKNGQVFVTCLDTLKKRTHLNPQEASAFNIQLRIFKLAFES